MTLFITKRRLGWYWRLVARNGRIRAIGGEPFASARNAERAFTSMRIAIGDPKRIKLVQRGARRG